jgi:hypothetical protein
VIGGWGKLYVEELRNLYSSPSIIRMMKSRKMRWARHVARMAGKRNEYVILVEKPNGRPGRRWENNFKMYLREVVWGGMDWNDPAQDRDRGGRRL